VVGAPLQGALLPAMLHVLQHLSVVHALCTRLLSNVGAALEAAARQLPAMTTRQVCVCVCMCVCVLVWK